jgi:hypothetical protein
LNGCFKRRDGVRARRRGRRQKIANGATATAPMASFDRVVDVGVAGRHHRRRPEV